MRSGLAVLASALWLPACVTALLLPACVSQGRFNEVAAERDALGERVVLLERSNTSLSAERVALLEELEDLRGERESLEVAVAQLEQRRSELSSELDAREKALRARERELARTRETYDGLVADLESQVAAGEIAITQLREGLYLNLPQEILFPPGSAQLGRAGHGVLRKVAGRLAELPHQVEVRGHSDGMPIASGRFPSNWELAAARAAEVVRSLVDSGVPGERLSVVSFGEYRPIASNDTPEGRAQNRRVEFIITEVNGAPVERGSTIRSPTR